MVLVLRRLELGCTVCIFVFFFFRDVLTFLRASQVALVVKNPPANAGDIRDTGWIPEL